MDEIYALLKKTKVFYLATIDGDRPRVRPMGATCVFDGKLYIQMARHKRVSKQIEANPNIEICTMLDGGYWIRIQAKAVNDDRAEAKQAMLDAHSSLKKYTDDDPAFQVLYLKDATAYITSPVKEDRVVKF